MAAFIKTILLKKTTKEKSPINIKKDPSSSKNAKKVV